MQLGEKVIHQGRVLVLRGLDPMSVSNAEAQVEDPRTGERFTVPLAELRTASGPRRGLEIAG